MDENHSNQTEQRPIPKREREFTMPGHVIISDETQKRIRRWFGWDMTLVLLFVFIALYFVWPLMFRKHEVYVTETAVSEGYTLITHLREYAASIEEKTEENIIEALNKHPGFKPPEKERSPRIYILDSAGVLKAKNEELPSFWEEVEMRVITNTRDVFIHKSEEISAILFVDQLPNTGLKIVIHQPFKPMFAPE